VDTMVESRFSMNRAQATISGVMKGRKGASEGNGPCLDP
jgi:hypothetical protein